MELKVFNISRHVPQSTIRILFSILGDIIFFDYYSSISRRDGTFECVIVYRELAEAQLAAKLDGTELGDRCLEVRLSQSIDRFDISFSSGSNAAGLTSRTLLIKSEEIISCDLDRISTDFEGISRIIELERDLGAGLPPLSARFFLVEFSTLEATELALKVLNYTVAEAHKHMQSYTIGTGTTSNNSPSSANTTTNNEEVLIYGVPASKLLDHTVRARASSSSSYSNKSSSIEENRTSNRRPSRSRSPDGRRNQNEYNRRNTVSSGYDRHRRDRSSSVGRRRRQ